MITITESVSLTTQKAYLKHHHVKPVVNQSHCLNVHDRSLERLLERAYDGFIWLLERKRRYYRYNAIPVSEAFIECDEWRKEIAKVIRLNEAEVEIIENLLIASKRLQYTDSDKILLMCLDQSQQIFMPNDDTGKAFVEWLEMPRE